MIIAVLGDVTPEEVGMTLTHEHLSLRFDGMFQTPPAYGDGKETCPFTMENLWFIKQNPLVIHAHIRSFTLSYLYCKLQVQKIDNNETEGKSHDICHTWLGFQWVPRV